jgi:hypothetical protein
VVIRSARCLQKLDRIKKALAHQEPDRVPVSDFFWGAFRKRWRTVVSNITPADYEFVVNLVRSRGVYPLRLGEFEEVV